MSRRNRGENERQNQGENVPENYFSPGENPQQNHHNADEWVNPDIQQPERQNHRNNDEWVNPDIQQPERQNHRNNDEWVNPDIQQPDRQNHRNNDEWVNPDLNNNKDKFENGHDNRDKHEINVQPSPMPMSEPVPYQEINYPEQPHMRPNPGPKPRPQPGPRPGPRPHPSPFVHPAPFRPQPPPQINNNFPPENNAPHPPGNPPPLRGLPSSYGQPMWKKRIPLPPPQIDYNRMIKDAPMPNFKTQSSNIDADEAKQIFVLWAEGCCCYGKSCARESIITSLKPSYGVQYSLETFTEKRYFNYDFCAYSNGFVDGPEQGPIPEIWSINVQPGQLFDSCTRQGKIPHTEQLMNCFRCNAVGKVRCSSCGGRGKDSCNSCRGSGQDHQGNMCNFCGGRGYDNCFRCGGRGGITCQTCNGHRRLKSFLEYEVHYSNKIDNYIHEATDLPDELMQTASGEILLSQTDVLLKPISNEYENRLVVDNSQRLFNKHFAYFQTERPIKQRQILKSVLVIECEYTWKDFNSRFWIYGNEQTVYTDDYPQMCCCCLPCICCKCCCTCTGTCSCCKCCAKCTII